MTALKPRIAVIPGDPNGIGPELIAKLLAESSVSELADVLVIGDRPVLEDGRRIAGVELALRPVESEALAWQGAGYPWLETRFFARDDIAHATVSKQAGVSSLRTLDIALDLASRQVVDGILFGPFNKAALIGAGMGHEDELHYMAERLAVRDYFCELNVLGGLWTSRVTSHVALKEVVEQITAEKIVEAVRIVDLTLRSADVARPRIAVAALNPHAGDQGNFGREEIDLIRPAVAEAARLQIDVTGPWPADTVFLKAKAGEIDAVVTMYHDQGQIAMKLMGFDRGVTVQGGLPIPVATPAHGTAFDIAGQGKANLGATRAAFELLIRMARSHHLQQNAA
jgi:4-hydroxythreonine-4-phosphate dehydrogenase